MNQSLNILVEWDKKSLNILVKLCPGTQILTSIYGGLGKGNTCKSKASGGNYLHFRPHGVFRNYLHELTL